MCRVGHPKLGDNSRIVRNIVSGAHQGSEIPSKPSDHGRKGCTEIRDDVGVIHGTDEIPQAMVVGSLKSLLRAVHGPIIGPFIGPSKLAIWGAIH